MFPARTRFTRRPARRPTARLWAEPLEGRLTPAVFNIPPGDTAALVAAVNASNLNNQPDTIELAAGSTYTFTAAADLADGGSALPTILRDTADANTLTIHGNGATLQRSADAGTPTFRLIHTGVFPNNVAVTITDLKFANGDAGTGLGGAILLQAGDLTLSGCTFRSNRADTGGAVYATTTDTNPRFVSVADSTFIGNAATGSGTGGAGGAVYVLGSSSLDLERDTLTLNTSAREGGAVRVQTSGGTITVADSLVANNTANGGNGGGGVFVQGTTTITNTTVRDNVSAAGGGGVWVQGGSLVMTGGVVTGNHANGTTAHAGGVFSQAATTITNSTVADNTCAGAAGGIGVLSGGSLTLTGSTVSGNRADNSVGSGGGVTCVGPLTIVNSTIHGNRAGSAGGVYFFGSAAVTGSITNSTITDNRAFYLIAHGGGIFDSADGPLVLANTIVAGNALEATATAGSGPDLYGSYNSLGYNLIQDTTGAMITGTTTGNVTGVSPNLGPLQDNGGPTFTRVPLPGSPARDAGDPAFAPPPATDQRGKPRVQNGRIDIGAVEGQVPTVTAVAVNDGSLQRSVVRSLTVTFDSAVTFAGGNAAAAFQLARTGPTGATGNVTLTPTVTTDAQGRTVVKLTFSGPFTESNTVAGINPSLIDGLYTLTVFGAAVTGADGVALDGDGDGLAGGDKVFATHRLFGDVDGDGDVDLLDLNSLVPALFGTVGQPAYNPAFDFEGDGDVDLLDLNQFVQRLFLSGYTP
ncbi:MAG TPA: right-handed parallel beta-helix repeat-containing protein [Gemmataceae bacterium]|jgi:predicted outer membrane repeat protein